MCINPGVGLDLNNINNINNNPLLHILCKGSNNTYTKYVTFICMDTYIVYMRDFSVTQTDSGTVFTTSSVAVYVHNSVDGDPERAANEAANIVGNRPDGTVRLEADADADRSHQERAMLLAILIDDVGYIRFDHGDVRRNDIDAARVPLTVAVNGKAAIACYLAVHRLSNGDIADLLDVSARTVSQYISDFRKGER